MPIAHLCYRQILFGACEHQKIRRCLVDTRFEPRMRNAYAMNHYGTPKGRCRKSSGNWRESIRAMPGVWRKGSEETLTVHRLGIGAVLHRKLATTNPIESCL